MSRTMPESRLQRQIKGAIVKKWPTAVVYKMHGSEFMESGIPDLSITLRGLAIWIEVKHPDTSHGVTPIQQAQLDRLRRAGAVAEVAESVDEAVQIIEKALDLGLGHD